MDDYWEQEEEEFGWGDSLIGAVTLRRKKARLIKR